MFFTRCRASLFVVLTVCLALPSAKSLATGVPIEGFLPMVGIGLTTEFRDDLTFSAIPSTSPGGQFLGTSGPHYDVALLDTGAGFSLLSAAGNAAFNLNGPYPGESDGFRGTNSLTLGGATGTLDAFISDPLGLYAGGLQYRTADNGPLVINHTIATNGQTQSVFFGQTNTSVITAPVESELPNVLGLTFASQYATHIHADQPQFFQLNNRTVRTPAVDFLPLGSGGGDIRRRAPLTLQPGNAFQSEPVWVLNLNLNLDKPYEDPSAPTLLPAGSGALFLTADLEDNGRRFNNANLFFDSGASISVLSELKALQLGIDVLDDQPEFTIDIVGSGGLTQNLPGYYLDELTILALGGSVTANNVPIVVLDIVNPGDPGNIVDGIIGTNLLAGRNLVIDPVPALGQGGNSPSLYISDPVTTEHQWATNATSATWSNTNSWSSAGVPDTLGIANVRNVSGINQTANLTADTTVWGLNVSGTPSATMTTRINNGVTLTTFGGTNLEPGGRLTLAGGTLDTQFVEIVGGTLTGQGLVTTGSGPIPGQVEIRSGVIAPGDGIGLLEIAGRVANGELGTMLFELGGTTPITQHDQLHVDGQVKLGGILEAVLFGNFNPVIGDMFTLITADDGIVGEFDLLDLPTGYTWDVEYLSNSLVLEVTGVGVTPGDFNSNGFVDGADLTAWRTGYGNTYDGGDFLTWQRNFGSGGIASNAVPEPASCVLLILALLSVTRGTKR